VSTAKDLVERLTTLSRVDRDWLLANLSPDARTNLLRQLGRNTSGVSAAESDRTPGLEDERALDAVDGATIATCLAGEPSWVIAMILGVRTWRWEHHVLASIAPVTRLEVNQLRGSLPRASAAMGSLLLRTLREQLTAPKSNLRFDYLLDRAEATGAQRT
jgi:hypothetical protein